MPLTVKIYKWTSAVGSGKNIYSLDEYPADENGFYDGFDDGGTDYELPHDYTVSENAYGEKMIFDQSGCGAELVLTKMGPALDFHYCDAPAIYLRKA